MSAPDRQSAIKAARRIVRWRMAPIWLLFMIALIVCAVVQNRAFKVTFQLFEERRPLAERQRINGEKLAQFYKQPTHTPEEQNQRNALQAQQMQLGNQMLALSNRQVQQGARTGAFIYASLAVIVLQLLATIYFLILNKRYVGRAKNGLCLRCGYDLRASDGRCPECGSLVTATTTASAS